MTRECKSREQTGESSDLMGSSALEWYLRLEGHWSARTWCSFSWRQGKQMRLGHEPARWYSYNLTPIIQFYFGIKIQIRTSQRQRHRGRIWGGLQTQSFCHPQTLSASVCRNIQSATNQWCSPKFWCLEFFWSFIKYVWMVQSLATLLNSISSSLPSQDFWLISPDSKFQPSNYMVSLSESTNINDQVWCRAPPWITKAPITQKKKQGFRR